MSIHKFSELAIVCPNCGYNSIKSEYKVDGNSICDNCAYVAKSSSFLIVHSNLVIDRFYTALNETKHDKYQPKLNDVKYCGVICKRNKIVCKLLILLRNDFDCDVNIRNFNVELKDLGFDSLSIHALYLGIEHVWNIKIDDNEICNDVECTLNSVIDSIYNCVHKR